MKRRRVKKNGYCPFNLFGKDLYSVLFSFFDWGEKLAIIAQVCKAWRDAIEGCYSLELAIVCDITGSANNHAMQELSSGIRRCQDFASLSRISFIGYCRARKSLVTLYKRYRDHPKPRDGETVVVKPLSTEDILIESIGLTWDFERLAERVAKVL